MKKHSSVKFRRIEGYQVGGLHNDIRRSSHAF